VTWKAIKDSQQFDWKSMDKKHNAYEVKSFGNQLAVVN
jgi:hypothetical protein